jgi:hypothetical protein
MTYHQCELEHRSDGRKQVSWIPSKFAEVGLVIRFKKADGGWDDGWLVRAVYSEKTIIQVGDMHNLWKRHRRFADLPQGTFKAEQGAQI